MSTNRQNNDFSERLDIIIKQIRQLAKDYPMTEYSFIINKWMNNGEYDTGAHIYDIKDCRNLDNYADSMIALKTTILERFRFKDLIHLPEFRVVCSNDAMDGKVQEAMRREGGGDWVMKSETYVVWKKLLSPTGGWTFFLRDKNNRVIKPPFPYQGWHCSRFIPADYTKEN